MMSEDSEQRLTNIDHTLDLMDFDGSDDLDINEFFEVCACMCVMYCCFSSAWNDLSVCYWLVWYSIHSAQRCIARPIDSASLLGKKRLTTLTHSDDFLFLPTGL